MTIINTSVIRDKLAPLSTEDLAQILLDNSDVELGKLVIPLATDSEGDGLPAEAAKQLWTVWGAAWREMGNAKLAEVMDEYSGEDRDGMYVIIPSSEQDGLFCCGDAFEVKHLSDDVYAARFNGQDIDFDWVIYRDVDALKEAYINYLDTTQEWARNRFPPESEYASSEDA